ncbi:hypothetical protein F4678DRAFT_459598 [Xylaria arbuscula]|nr:hypothetical protein F4678DRAFT_459598 [Xylaria arbuscula]
MGMNVADIASIEVTGLLYVLKELDVVRYEDIKNTVLKGSDAASARFTAHPLFGSWLYGSPSVLWAFAYPGSGKSLFARYLVDQYIPTTEKRTTCYFFFEDDRKSYRHLSSAMCSILRQLFEQRPELLSEATVAEFYARNTLTMSFSSLWKILIDAARRSSSGGIICIIDGLGKCKKRDKRQLISALNTLYHSDSNLKLPDIRFLLTSCPFGHTQRHFQPTGKVVPYIRSGIRDHVTVSELDI